MRDFRIDSYLNKEIFCFLILSGRSTQCRLGIFLTIRSSMSSSTSTASSVQQVGRILEGRNDNHGGVIVEMTSEPLDPVVFVSLLKASLSHWRQQVLFILALIITQTQLLFFSSPFFWNLPKAFLICKN